MKDIILVYGNCQAGVFADAFKFFKDAAETHETRFVGSFVHPTDPVKLPGDDELDRCALILEQVDAGNPLPHWLRDKVNKDAVTLKFPALDFNLLWPLNFNDPRNVSEPPDFPFGRYPYGDRIVVELLREGLAGEALWTAYERRSAKRLPDLINRLKTIERQRLATRDAVADVKIGDLIFSQYREKRLFWTINHPTGWLLGQVMGNLLQAARDLLSFRNDPRLEAERVFSSYQPFEHQHQPIHPGVGWALDLKWWTPDLAYRYFDGTLLTFEEYMKRYIDFK